MLSYEQKLYLVKKVDYYALSSVRKEKLPGFFRKFKGPYSESDYNQISDLVCLQKTSVKEAKKKSEE